MTKKEKTLRILKYIGLITYIAVTAFLVYMMCLFLPDYIAQIEYWSVGAVICMLVTLYASIGYIIPIVLGIIGTVMSSKMQNRKSKRNCIIMIIAPLATAIVNFATYLIILK